MWFKTFPESICLLNFSYPSLNEFDFSATSKPAAAFKQTAIEKSLSLPWNISFILVALYSGSFPTILSKLIASIPKSFGFKIDSLIFPSLSSTISVFA